MFHRSDDFALFYYEADDFRPGVQVRVRPDIPLYAGRIGEVQWCDPFDGVIVTFDKGDTCGFDENDLIILSPSKEEAQDTSHPSGT